MPSFEQRQLGAAGPQTSAMGLGCWGMSGSYGASDDAEALRTIDRALELGITFLDTADVYGEGHNEEFVGRALQGRRDRVTLATKFGRTFGTAGARGVNGRPEYVRAACDASLKRLGIDTIDLYYQHRVDPNVPIEETVGAMAELKAAGKIRYLGLSEASADNVRRAAAVHPIAALQSEYSLFSRDVEDNGVLPTIRELGIALVPYSPLGRGMLTATVRTNDGFGKGDPRSHNPRFAGDNFARNVAVVDQLSALAAELKLTSAQLALAWLYAQGNDIVPIPGTKRVKNLEENAVAAGHRLGLRDIARIGAIAPKGVAAGARSQDPITLRPV
ncbi:MAG TPA: aldo/keto reductase [Candidatus Lustribacter sp.]|jgi:aryl-alcohol dehydrogenase-like predicted oxidoreductase|nr:aldo/keto reductase [Candidatus Lustribacter sp.]